MFPNNTLLSPHPHFSRKSEVPGPNLNKLMWQASQNQEHAVILLFSFAQLTMCLFYCLLT